MSKATPWAVICHRHGRVYLTQQQYDVQMNKPDSFWLCPVCGDVAGWDDDNYEKHMELLEREAEEVQQ
jgi:uncharacterized protein with PIN domain